MNSFCVYTVEYYGLLLIEGILILWLSWNSMQRIFLITSPHLNGHCKTRFSCKKKYKHVGLNAKLTCELLKEYG